MALADEGASNREHKLPPTPARQFSTLPGRGLRGVTPLGYHLFIHGVIMTGLKETGAPLWLEVRSGIVRHRNHANRLIKVPSIASRCAHPHNCMDRTSSVRKISNARVTPASPPALNPYK